METKISDAELAERLDDVLERVRLGHERFVIERDGHAVATIAPAAPRPGITWATLGDVLRDIPWPDEDFAKDLEEIRAAQPRMQEPPEWPE